MSIGSLVRAARVERKMSLAELGRAARLTKGFISQVESGLSNPSLITLQRLAQSLGLPVSALLGEAGSSAEAEVRDQVATQSEDAPLVVLTAREGLTELLPPTQGVRKTILISLPGEESLKSPAAACTSAGGSLLAPLTGAVSLRVGDLGATLRPGEVALFDANQAYSITPIAGRDVQLLITLSSALDIPARISTERFASKKVAPPPKIGSGPFRLVELRAASRTAGAGRRR